MLGKYLLLYIGEPQLDGYVKLIIVIIFKAYDSMAV